MEKIFWLISVPQTNATGSSVDAFNSFKKLTEPDFAQNWKFNIPNLKVGGLNGLMILSDDLGKQDSNVENNCRKIFNQLVDLMDGKQKLDLTVNNVSVEEYLQKFAWDEAKFSSTKPLGELLKSIMDVVVKVDSDIREKSAEYQTINNELMSEVRKQGQNLLTRDLADVQIQPVSSNSAIADALLKSEYLQVTYVVVQKTTSKEFLQEYETLTDLVVPGSCEKLIEDNDFVLYRLVLFSRIAEDFKRAAAEKKWTVRPYQPDTKKSADRRKLETDREYSKRQLIKVCRAMFSEIFVAWTHLKALRTFVESVLRYALPTNFQCILVLPTKSKVQKLRKVLHTAYAHLAKGIEAGKEDEDDYYPYVYTQINLDFRTKV